MPTNDHTNKPRTRSDSSASGDGSSRLPSRAAAARERAKKTGVTGTASAAPRERKTSSSRSSTPQAPTRRSIRNSATPPTAPVKTAVPHKGKKKAQKKPNWAKRIGLGIVCGLFALFFLGAGTFLFLYLRTSVPVPDEFALAQTTKVYYQDGENEIGTLSEVNRQIIDTSSLPDYVSKAIVSSEDRTFYTNSGIDIKGILRALVTNITTGTRQGGSTLTQQYVERYYVGETTSYLGKLKEAVLAIKINREQSKDEILGNYLNTIYFGRGAYGIEAATQAFFGHSAKELTLSESAMIAGIIPAPSAWDPEVDMVQAQSRWKRVLNLMVEDGWISPAEAEQQIFPETISQADVQSSAFTGTNGYLIQQIRAELLATGNFTQDDIDSGGLRIISTIDKARQEAAVAAAQSMFDVRGWDKSTMHTALTSVDPRTGEIVAEYAGDDYQLRQQNAATQDIAMAGSTFKVFALLANARAGGSVYDMYDSTSGRRFPGLAAPVNNAFNRSWGRVTLVEALQYSANTAFVELNEKIGPSATLKAAVDAGIPENTSGLEATLLNTLGFAAPHNVDIAGAFSTIANGGKRIAPHIVREVYSAEGDKKYVAPTSGNQVFSTDEVSSIMPALEAVTGPRGTISRIGAAQLGLKTAGKTGTSEDQLSAVVVAFVPELVTAVSQYQTDENGNSVPLTNIGGIQGYFGDTWPTDVWLNYMKAVRSSLSVQDFSWYVPPKNTRVVPEEPMSTDSADSEQSNGGNSQDSRNNNSPALPSEPTQPDRGTTPSRPDTEGDSGSNAPPRIEEGDSVPPSGSLGRSR
ncbi:transglycosylase domain-containing protein [Schaalia sp. lx-100]|uniref:transglycosylase domain-containing protein n=1 Tax=Schaalia sp. lx-100 TaxID=2899081 RepID=UPI001E3241BD|nr:penicillin-binding protein [Schaalia sp. lx-100]